MTINPIQHCNFCSARVFHHDHNCSGGKCNHKHHHHHGENQNLKSSKWKDKIGDALHHIFGCGDLAHTLEERLPHTEKVYKELQQVYKLVKGKDLPELKKINVNGEYANLVLKELIKDKSKNSQSKSQMPLVLITLGTILAAVLAFVFGKKTDDTSKESTLNLPSANDFLYANSLHSSSNSQNQLNGLVSQY